MEMKAASILILACALLIQGCEKATDPVATRQKELAGILKPLLKPEVYSFWDDEIKTSAGWCEPTNRQALKLFIAKYPETEESYQASVWLAFASAYTERCPIPSEEKHRVTELTERLKMVSQKTSQHGIERMAKLERVFRLYGDGSGDHAEFYGQVNDILSHIGEFESENDEVFRHYLKMVEMRPSEIEPTLRFLVVNEKCCDHQQDQALELAKELKQIFPSWEPQSVNSAIEMMGLYKRGWTPSNSVRDLSKN
jgi:hypothetical protein